MIYQCNTCGWKLLIDQEAKTKCGTCNLYYTKGADDAKDKEDASPGSSAVAVETSKRQVRDMW